MFKRYLSIGVVAVILFFCYLIFFNKPKVDNDYNLYYQKLKTQETFVSESEFFDIGIEKEIGEGDNFNYIISFENFTSKLDDVKILFIDEKVVAEDEIYYYPSFGIVSYKGYSFDIKENKDINNNVLDGVNLVKYNNKKIDYLLIYFAYNENEIFLKLSLS